MKQKKSLSYHFNIRCPHRRNPIEVVKITPREEIACPPLLVVARDAHNAVFSLFTALHTFEIEAFKHERDAKAKGAGPPG